MPLLATALTALLSVAAPAGQAHATGIAVEVMLAPGESWSYHVEDVHWPMLYASKSVVANDQMALFSVSETVMGHLALDPGAMFYHQIDSMTPYSDEEGFTNLGGQPQIMAGTVVLPFDPPVSFSDSIMPDLTGHVFIDPQDPSPEGSYSAAKWIENVDDFLNEWGYDSTTLFEPIALDAGMTWTSRSSHDNGDFTDYWLEITNEGDEAISLSVQVDYSTPEPTTLVLAMVTGLALIGCGRRRAG